MLMDCLWGPIRDLGGGHSSLSPWVKLPSGPELSGFLGGLLGLGGLGERTGPLQKMYMM